MRFWRLEFLEKFFIVTAKVQSLRVLHILGELKPSGAECMLKVGAKVFASNRICNEILSTGTSQIGSYASTLETVGYPVYHLPFAKSFVVFVRLYKLIRIRRYDVIHIHSERASFWYALTARMAGVLTVVSTVHAIFAFHGWLRIRRMIFRWLMDRMGVTRVAISKSVQNAEWKYFRSQLRIINNWYDPEEFAPPSDVERREVRRQYGLSDQSIAIVSVGNCSDIKNHKVVIEAIASIPKEFPVVYLHVGGEEAHCPERVLAKKLGVSDNSKFFGQVKNPVSILHASDIFVMPSLSEGFGNAALEAFAVGLPVILSNAQGLRDFAERFPNIQYATPTADSFRSAILELISLSPNQRREMCVNYSRIARESFSIENGVAEYARLYWANQKNNKQPNTNEPTEI